MTGVVPLVGVDGGLGVGRCPEMGIGSQESGVRSKGQGPGVGGRGQGRGGPLNLLTGKEMFGENRGIGKHVGLKGPPTR